MLIIHILISNHSKVTKTCFSSAYLKKIKEFQANKYVGESQRNPACRAKQAKAIIVEF